SPRLRRRRRRSRSAGEAAAVGEIRGGDQGFDPARGAGLAGYIRQRGGRGAGIRPGGVLDERVRCHTELPGGEGGGVARGHGLQPPGDGGGSLLPCDRSEEEALHAAENDRESEEREGSSPSLNLVVLEDLGADYLEELMTTCSDFTATSKPDW
ncbi:unnamed protein product, partial [Linum tenue]